VEASNRPGPIGMIGTALLGLAGSFLDGLFARYTIGLHHRHSLLDGFILAVICAAIIVAAIDRHRRLVDQARGRDCSPGTVFGNLCARLNGQGQLSTRVMVRR
jgi:uncharacterized membrane protein YeaQ/YmgE (transglycosylase-associated protein family)